MMGKGNKWNAQQLVQNERECRHNKTWSSICTYWTTERRAFQTHFDTFKHIILMFASYTYFVCAIIRKAYLLNKIQMPRHFIGKLRAFQLTRFLILYPIHSLAHAFASQFKDPHSMHRSYFYFTFINCCCHLVSTYQTHWRQNTIGTQNVIAVLSSIPTHSHTHSPSLTYKYRTHKRYIVNSTMYIHARRYGHCFSTIPKQMWMYSNRLGVVKNHHRKLAKAKRRRKKSIYDWVFRVSKGKQKKNIAHSQLLFIINFNWKTNHPSAVLCFFFGGEN